MTSRHNRSNYEAILKMYREVTMVPKEISKELGIDKDVVIDAIENGWTDIPWAKSIRDVVADEVDAARAKRHEMVLAQAEQEQKVAQQARTDSIKARSEELQASRISRANAIGAAAALSRMVRGLVLIGEEFEERIGDKQKRGALSMQELRKWVQVIGAAVQNSQNSLKACLEIERIITGQPISMIGVRVEQMNPEEMAEKMKVLVETAQRNGHLASEEDILDAEIVMVMDGE